VSLFILILAACDEPTSQSTQTGTEQPSVTDYEGSVLMVLDDESLFCDGDLLVERSEDVLLGSGNCGDTIIEVDGAIDSLGAVSGTVLLSKLSAQSATLTGELDGDELVLIWSIEIPLPDDPIADEDLYQLIVYGEASLTAL
jgi:hypothetical protein